MSGYQNFQISVQDPYEGSQYAEARFGRGTVQYMLIQVVFRSC